MAAPIALFTPGLCGRRPNPSRIRHRRDGRFQPRDPRRSAGPDGVMCLPRSPSARIGLSCSISSGYGRRRVGSPLGRPRNDQVALPDPARACSREPCAPAASRGAHPNPHRPALTPGRVGPGLLGDPLAEVGGLETGAGDRGARHGRPLASRRVQAVLEAAKSARTSGTPWAGPPDRTADPVDGGGQYSPLITKNEPRMVPASFDFCFANLKRGASSGGTSIPSESLKPTARFFLSSIARHRRGHAS